MLNVALCDDDDAEREAIARLIESYRNAQGAPIVCLSAFSNARDMIAAAHEHGPFDACFLDVIMPDMDGIEAGRRLRAAGYDGIIVYLSASRDFAVESYRVRAFDYLVKPIARDQLFAQLDTIAAIAARRDSQSILVPTTAGETRLLISDILYAERAGRGIRYRLAGRSLESRTIRSSFKHAVEPLLSDARFVLCGASFALNLEQVVRVGEGEAVFSDGSSVALPRAAQAEFKRAWGHFWLDSSVPHGAGAPVARGGCSCPTR